MQGMVHEGRTSGINPAEEIMLPVCRLFRYSGLVNIRLPFIEQAAYPVCNTRTQLVPYAARLRIATCLY